MWQTNEPYYSEKAKLKMLKKCIDRETDRVSADDDKEGQRCLKFGVLPLNASTTRAINAVQNLSIFLMDIFTQYIKDSNTFTNAVHMRREKEPKHLKKC
jgi:hypothetical protein